MISLLFITGIKKMKFWAKLHSKNDFFSQVVIKTNIIEVFLTFKKIIIICEMH